MEGRQMSFFESLAKPAWAPAAGVYGTVWSILYPIIFIAYGYVIFKVFRGDIPWVVLLPIGINLLANFAFTPIQFGLENLGLAAIDIVIVLVTIVWSMVAIWPYSRLVVLALVPYLVWVAIATTLQMQIWWLNR
jgi:tryptophan-rich sensory protein